MAKTTVRTRVGAVTLTPNEVLEYRLTVKGAKGNFSWADKNGPILTADAFVDAAGLPTANELVWVLRSTSADAGKIKLTVPQNPAYQRVAVVGAAPAFTLALAFVFATGYTLKVTHRAEDGSQIAACTDIDYSKEQDNDEVDEGLSVVLGSGK